MFTNVISQFSVFSKSGEHGIVPDNNIVFFRPTAEPMAAAAAAATDASDGEEKYLSPKRFLERYSLPRIVNIIREEQEQISDKNGVSTLLDDKLLLFRHYVSRKIEARNFPYAGRSVTRHHSAVADKSLPFTITDESEDEQDSTVMAIPNTNESWFSVVTERGQLKARLYTTIQALIIAQVTAFLVDNTRITGYVQLFHRNEIGGTQKYYRKICIKKGSVLTLLAIYQDIHVNPARVTPLSWPLSGAKQELVYYAQCLTETKQIVYISLRTRGCFYAVSTANRSANDNISKVYQINKLLQVFPLPVRVCVVAPEKQQGSMLLENYRKEQVILACVLGINNNRNKYRFLEIDVNSKFHLSRIADEYKLFQHPLVQKALKQCHLKGYEWSKQFQIVYDIYPEKEVTSNAAIERKMITEIPSKFKKKAAYQQHLFKKDRKKSLGDKKTVRSVSFKFSHSYNSTVNNEALFSANHNSINNYSNINNNRNNNNNFICNNHNNRSNNNSIEKTDSALDPIARLENLTNKPNAGKYRQLSNKYYGYQKSSPTAAHVTTIAEVNDDDIPKSVVDEDIATKLNFLKIGETPNNNNNNISSAAIEFTKNYTEKEEIQTDNTDNRNNNKYKTRVQIQINGLRRRTELIEVNRQSDRYSFPGDDMLNRVTWNYWNNQDHLYSEIDH